MSFSRGPLRSGRRSRTIRFWPARRGPRLASSSIRPSRGGPATLPFSLSEGWAGTSLASTVSEMT
eukprot:3715891-Pyramimonas_sp.AAC.1